MSKVAVTGQVHLVVRRGALVALQWCQYKSLKVSEEEDEPATEWSGVSECSHETCHR